MEATNSPSRELVPPALLTLSSTQPLTGAHVPQVTTWITTESARSLSSRPLLAPMDSTSIATQDVQLVTLPAAPVHPPPSVPLALLLDTQLIAKVFATPFVETD